MTEIFNLIEMLVFQSPQTPRSFDHQSPTSSAGQSPASHMHMRTPMHKPADIQGQIQPRSSLSPYRLPGASSQKNKRQLHDLMQNTQIVGSPPENIPPNVGKQPEPSTTVISGKTAPAEPLQLAKATHGKT